MGLRVFRRRSEAASSSTAMAFALTTKFIRVLTSLPNVSSKYLAISLAGWRKKKVARILSISVKTVGSHTTHIMEKLDIHDRVELARFAVREGLVTL